MRKNIVYFAVLVVLLFAESCSKKELPEPEKASISYYTVPFDEFKGLPIPDCSNGEPATVFLSYQATFNKPDFVSKGYYDLGESIQLQNDDEEYLVLDYQVLDKNFNMLYRMQRGATGAWIKITNGVETLIPVMCKN